MITTLANAPRTTNLVNLADTNYAVLVDSASKTVKVLESLSVTCKDTDTDVTIVLTKDGTDYILWYQVTVTAKSRPKMLTDYYPHHLRLDNTMKIRIKASAGNQITAIAVTLDQIPQTVMGGGMGSVAGNY